MPSGDAVAAAGPAAAVALVPAVEVAEHAPT
jgi:hypothetical protein